MKDFISFRDDRTKLVIALLLVFTSAFSIFFINIEKEGWHGDEKYYIWDGQEYIKFLLNYDVGKAQTLARYSITHCAHPYTGKLIIGMLLSLFGKHMSELGDCDKPPDPDIVAIARLPSALLGALTIVVIAYFASKIAGYKGVLFVSLFLLGTPLFTLYSREALMDIYVSSFIVLGYLFFYLSLKYDNISLLLICGVFLGFAVGSKFGVGGIMSALMLIVLLLNKRFCLSFKSCQKILRKKSTLPTIIISLSASFLIINSIYLFILPEAPHLILGLLQGKQADVLKWTNGLHNSAFLANFDPRIYYSYPIRQTLINQLLFIVGVLTLAYIIIKREINNIAVITILGYLSNFANLFLFEWYRTFIKLAPWEALIASLPLTFIKDRRAKIHLPIFLMVITLQFLNLFSVWSYRDKIYFSFCLPFLPFFNLDTIVVYISDSIILVTPIFEGFLYFTGILALLSPFLVLLSLIVPYNIYLKESFIKLYNSLSKLRRLFHRYEERTIKQILPKTEEKHVKIIPEKISYNETQLRKELSRPVEGKVYLNLEQVEKVNSIASFYEVYQLILRRMGEIAAVEFKPNYTLREYLKLIHDKVDDKTFMEFQELTILLERAIYSSEFSVERVKSLLRSLASKLNKSREQ
jgi:hypothetical protein